MMKIELKVFKDSPIRNWFEDGKLTRSVNFEEHLRKISELMRRICK